jgi:predicted TIM-barrel fold metal-dependent hydrolase
VPVAIHTADPRAFFEPVDEHNERLEQLLANPQWSFADPRFPRFERLLEALEAVVATHPGTVFVAVHCAGNPEDLGWVDRMLSTYGNLHVDISARLAELGRQPRATRRLVMAHPDRVLFGTDAFPISADTYELYERFLQTDDEYFSHDPHGSALMGRWAISGLDLPEDVLRQVYAGNALRLVPAFGNPS